MAFPMQPLLFTETVPHNAYETEPMITKSGSPSPIRGKAELRI